MRRRGGSRTVEGKRIMGPWEDMKSNKALTTRRRRMRERKLLHDARS